MSQEAQAEAARSERFPHGVDVGVRGTGPSLEAAFEQTALALTAVLADPKEVKTRTAVDVVCEAPDPATFHLVSRNILRAAIQRHPDPEHLADPRRPRMRLRAGECPRWGTPLAHIAIAERTACSCPSCQRKHQ